MEHTPGPWQVVEFGGSFVVMDDAYFDMLNTFCNPNALANAKLAAASPDLYEALSELIADYEKSDFDVVGKNEALIEKAKAALKKATE